MQAAKTSKLNDFVLRIANVNGTGSATANSLLVKAIFRMGIPVSGKNFFPSNIQGLPTWFEIRVNESGHLARAGHVDIMAAMNAATYQEDMEYVKPGGTLLYDATWPRARTFARDDIVVLGVPFAAMCNAAFDDARVRILMKNMAYVGTLAALLGIEFEVLETLLEERLGGKPGLVDTNRQALAMGYDQAHEKLERPLSERVERRSKTERHILIDGNTAAALGCLYAGATVAAWYPITPSTSLVDAFRALCAKHRKNPDGENRYCVVQAEDELGALGMVVGAGWNGARAFTATSGPGVSLMSEFLGFAYYAEIPLVLFDVQRVGPSTGMPTRTQQSDLMACAYASHGDTRHVVLFPANPRECFYFAVQAFDLAERLQTPVIVLSDLDIGMNEWMCEELEWDDAYEPDRGKVLDRQALEQMPDFRRYLDVDDDAICYRSLPGTHPNGAYFTRGSGHNQSAAYTESSREYQAVVDRLKRKHDSAAQLVPGAAIRQAPKATKLGIISFGSADSAINEAIDRLSAEGLALDYLRICAFPFAQDVQAFLDRHECLFVVEQNRDAQLKSMLRMETNVSQDKLISVLHYSGLPIDAASICREITVQLEHGAAA